ALGAGPAFVLGSSGGAQIGLNLAARHPERVRTLVAHEPPCLRLLADAERMEASIEDLYGLFSREGAGVAMQRFWEIAGLGGPPEGGPATPTPEAMETMARIGGNLDYFFRHGLRPISLYVPNVDALRASPARIVVGVGVSSAGQLAHRTALALAETLGTP